MTLNLKNQNDILNLENLNSNEIEYIFNDKPINRLKTKPQLEDKKKLLLELKNEIENNRKDYGTLVDKTTLELENFIKRNDTDIKTQ